ncbi:MAG: NAD(+)/NADH kinase [Natronomonas sp.]
MTRVGLIVNPAAGHDIRRLTGGASVVDDYAKRRVAGCVLDGLTTISDPPSVEIMPDRSGIADTVVSEAPDSIHIEQIEMSVEGSAADTQRAAEHFSDDADVAVVLGGDGTTRDAAMEIGDVPVVSVSTGTNNVVPTPVDGTVAGAAAAIVATDRIDVDAAIDRHGTVDVVADDVTGTKRLNGLATVEITDRSFIGTRAVVDPSELLGGVVSRAHPVDIGLGAAAGCLEPLAPDDPGGAALRLDAPDETDRTVRAIIAPGMVAEIGVVEHERLSWGESAVFEISDVVIGADGEREIEIVDATVEMTPRHDGLRLVDAKRTLKHAAEAGILSEQQPGR